VLRSPALAPGEEHVLDSAPLTLGRSGDNDIPLPGDEFASSAHARLEPRRDGVWIEDVGSTNGTFVNGERVEGRRRLSAGDVVRVGETDLRFE
jgi:pSer/pThr/pTyr-binding forkhead associated (FHA) protein